MKIFGLAERWFEAMVSGKKVVEGRVRRGRFAELAVGDRVVWVNRNRGLRSTIVGLTEYPSFERYLLQEGLKRTLPGTETLDQGQAVYYEFYTKQQEAEFGVVAIELEHGEEVRVEKVDGKPVVKN